MLNERPHMVFWQPAFRMTYRPMSIRLLSRAGYPTIKRWLDVLISAASLVLLSPLLIAIAIAIKLDSPGPIIYVQRRCGLRGRVFSFYKFRSMTNGRDHTEEHRKFAEAYINGANGVPAGQTDGNGRTIFKPSSNGHTVTRVGRWLRCTSLDELPQLINIIKGDMSLVGPRPSIDYELAWYTDRHRQRLAVLPGLTGWAQINGRSRLGFDEIVSLDLAYIARRSVRHDLQILFATILKVLRAEDVG